MEIVIKISDEDYEILKTHNKHGLYSSILNGTPLLKHGRLIDKDHMIARLEAASKFYGGECADAFDERYAQGLKEAAIKVAEEPTIVEASKTEADKDGGYRITDDKRREEAINKLNWALDNNTIEDIQSAYDYIMAIKMAIEALEQEPKTGHWYYDEERGATGIYAICSNCDEEIYQTGDFKYCPNCGAKMK